MNASDPSQKVGQQEASTVVWCSCLVVVEMTMNDIRRTMCGDENDAGDN